MLIETSFGAWLADRRKQLGFSRVALAQRIGCATVTLQKIELNERRPSEQIAGLLADQLQIQLAKRSIFIRVARGELATDRLAASEQPANTFAKPSVALIGRDADLHTLAKLLAETQLLTLTGSGGVGKTSLARVLLYEQHMHYTDGVCMVDLAPLSNSDQVLPAIAQQLGIADVVGMTSEQRLCMYFQQRHMLVLLDNFEHVLDAASQLPMLLQAAPQLTLIVTSRTVLRLTNEQHYAVQPLALPQPAKHTIIDNKPNWHNVIAQSPAVQLFVKCARARLPDFHLNETNATAIASICHHLDGLPLAIELAAARCTLFSPQELIERLRRNTFALLTHGARDLPARQQTMQATLDWSYQLLTMPQQRLFKYSLIQASSAV